MLLKPPTDTRHPSLMTGGSQIISVALDATYNGWRLDRALADALPGWSRERLKALVKAGALTRSGKPVRDPSAKVAGDEAFELAVPEPTALHNLPQDIALTIIHEDDDLLVVDKPAGLVVHPAAGNADGTLVNALLHHCAGRLSGIGGVARPGIVHRIDKDTSGLLVVAKTDAAHEGLARQFEAHSIDRRYVAAVSGIPRLASGTIEGYLARSPTDRKKVAMVKDGRGKRAVTHWSLLERFREAAVVECRLETGRTHQVRVQMASIGHPLLGDPVYGRAPHQRLREMLARLGFARQALHAANLGFVHPVTKVHLSFESNIPQDMQELFSALGV